MSIPVSTEFRASRFADFNAGTVSETPDTLFQTMSDPLRLEDKLDLFECRVEVWQLAPAVAILKQIESHAQPSVWCHTAYALVAILTSYFEMIGKTVNPDSKARNTASKDFNAGFQDIYPHFVFTDDDGNTKPSGHVRDARDSLRNGMYHLGYTKRGVVLHNKPDSTDDFEPIFHPLAPNPSGATHVVLFGVNPHRLTRTIVTHFATFMSRLRDSANTALRAKFEEFYDSFHIA